MYVVQLSNNCLSLSIPLPAPCLYLLILLTKNQRKITTMSAPLVTVQLYAESLCPDCINYSTSQLSDLMSSIPEIVDLQVFPYGNAEETGPDDDGSYEFTCQHGDNECYANLLEACAISHYPDVVMDLPTWYPFYECMESSPYNQNRSGDYNTTVAIGCAQELDWVWLDWNLLEGCAGGEEGNELMHKVAQATPEHDYVPWVVVDGVTVPDSGEGYPAGNLVEIVCEAYTGDKPDACL